MDSLVPSYRNKRIEISVYLMLLCLILNNIFSAFITPLLPSLIIKLIEVGFTGGFFFFLIQLISFKNITDGYLKIIFPIFILWEIFIIVRGFSFEYNFLSEFLSDPYRMLQYFIPLIVLIPITSEVSIRQIFNYGDKLSNIFLIALPIFFILELFSDQSTGEQFIWIFSCGSGFALIVGYYWSGKKNIKYIAVILLSLLLSTMLARRNIMLTCCGYLFAALFVYLYYNEKIKAERKIAALFLIVLLAIGGLFVFVSNQSGLFNLISERATIDSRDVVFALYYEGMNEDADNWIYGKGVNGSYYAPLIDSMFQTDEVVVLEHRDVDDRLTIESGYLQLILNGGIVYLILYLLVLVPAAINGFKGKNILTKGAAVLIVLWLIDMFPFGLPAFRFRYLLVWFCVAICYDQKLRMKNNAEIREILTFK